MAKLLSVNQKKLKDYELRAKIVLNISSSFFHCQKYSSSAKVGEYGLKIIDHLAKRNDGKQLPAHVLQLEVNFKYIIGVSLLVENSGTYEEMNEQEVKKCKAALARAENQLISGLVILQENFPEDDAYRMRFLKFISRTSDSLKRIPNQLQAAHSAKNVLGKLASSRQVTVGRTSNESRQTKKEPYGGISEGSRRTGSSKMVERRSIDINSDAGGLKRSNTGAQSGFRSPDKPAFILKHRLESSAFPQKPLIAKKPIGPFEYSHATITNTDQNRDGWQNSSKEFLIKRQIRKGSFQTSNDTRLIHRGGYSSRMIPGQNKKGSDLIPKTRKSFFGIQTPKQPVIINRKEADSQGSSNKHQSSVEELEPESIKKIVSTESKKLEDLKKTKVELEEENRMITADRKRMMNEISSLVEAGNLKEILINAISKSPYLVPTPSSNKQSSVTSIGGPHFAFGEGRFSSQVMEKMRSSLPLDSHSVSSSVKRAEGRKSSIFEKVKDLHVNSDVSSQKGSNRGTANGSLRDFVSPSKDTPVSSQSKGTTFKLSKPAHLLTIRNYRGQQDDSILQTAADSKRYLRQFNINLQQLVEDFANEMQEKSLIYEPRSLIISEGFYISAKTVIEKDHKKKLKMSITPEFKRAVSSKDTLDQFDGYFCQSEVLREDDLIRLLEEVRHWFDSLVAVLRQCSAD